MRLSKKALLHNITRQLDRELDKEPEQWHFMKVRLLLDLIAYLEMPDITEAQFKERTAPLIEAIQNFNKEKQKE